jgi:TolB-like protein/DNA-binding winged helix-turn-helix (wHTH) protein/tetratricopeptide (TPR) repeat protein
MGELVSPNHRFGNIEVRVAERTLLIDGNPVALGARAFDVLQALVEHRDRIVSKDELLELAWPGLVVEENNLAVQISTLRKLLGQHAIVTIPGRGYQFCLREDSQLASATAASVASAGEDGGGNGAAAPGVSRSGRLALNLTAFHKKSGAFIAIAATVVLLSGAAVYLNAYQAARLAKRATAISPEDIPAGQLSVVVLPFVNLTGDANQAYVADGMTAGITSDLSRIRDAFIVNARTAATYKDKGTSALQVGAELGVHFVLQGSVQRSGSKIRVNAQLADATTDAQLWSDSFEGDQSDLFSLQDQVTSRIGNSIGREMVITAARGSETRKSSPNVSDLMLRAVAMDLKPVSLKNLQASEELYRQVLALEPNNPNAMVRLATCLVRQPDFSPAGMSLDIQEKKFAEARDLALRVKEIDPDNPEVYRVMGLYALNHGDSDGFRRAAETRVALEPKNPGAYVSLAVSFYFQVEPKRAIELLNKSISLDPKHVNYVILYDMGRAYFMLGDNDAAIEYFLKARESNPDSTTAGDYAYLAMAYALKGDDAKARAEADVVRRLDPNYKLTVVVEQYSNSPPGYRDWIDKKFVPAWRKAGLPG